jgi:hypothetical protein
MRVVKENVSLRGRDILFDSCLNIFVEIRKSIHYISALGSLMRVTSEVQSLMDQQSEDRWSTLASRSALASRGSILYIHVTT